MNPNFNTIMSLEFTALQLRKQAESALHMASDSALMPDGNGSVQSRFNAVVAEIVEALDPMAEAAGMQIIEAEAEPAKITLPPIGTEPEAAAPPAKAAQAVFAREAKHGRPVDENKQTPVKPLKRHAIQPVAKPASGAVVFTTSERPANNRPRIITA